MRSWDGGDGEDEAEAEEEEEEDGEEGEVEKVSWLGLGSEVEVSVGECRSTALEVGIAEGMTTDSLSMEEFVLPHSRSRRIISSLSGKSEREREGGREKV